MKRAVNVFYLCVMLTILGLLHTSVSNQCYGDNNTPQNTLLKEYKSPSGDIIVRHIVDGKKGDLEIWLYSAKNPSNGEFLFSYEIDADVKFSYDEKWLVLNHNYGSTDTEAILFKRVKGLKYEVREFLDDKAWRLFEKKDKKHKVHVFKWYGQIEVFLYDHSNADAVLWSSDSKSVLIEIYGHHDETSERLEPWYCIYDVTTGKMTLDFNRVFNRDTFHPNGKAKGRELYIY